MEIVQRLARVNATLALLARVVTNAIQVTRFVACRSFTCWFLLFRLLQLSVVLVLLRGFDLQWTRKLYSNGCVLVFHQLHGQRMRTVCSKYANNAYVLHLCADAPGNWPACPACTNSGTCLGNGVCSGDTCSCNTGFAGLSCNSCATSTFVLICLFSISADYFGYPACTFCQANTNCNGHGSCSAGGGCACSEGFAGAACDSCASSECFGCLLFTCSSCRLLQLSVVYLLFRQHV